ncbi:MAG: hypothetical protein IT381_12740 [Deltaproteobacteria bacterium]|nr:hypothetical protein [Deltaproteobacteria bacterium]
MLLATMVLASASACGDDARLGETNARERLNTAPPNGMPPGTTGPTTPSGSTGSSGANGSTGATGVTANTPAPRPTGASGPMTPGANGCKALVLAKNTNVSGYTTDLYTWSDGACRERSAAMVPNTGRDAGGTYGGYARRFTYDIGAVRTVESSHPSHHGFGFIVNHFSGGAELSTRHAGTTATIFTGAHHALHEYKWSYPVNGRNVDFTVRWLFATGKDHPVWTITYDTSKLAKDALVADSRSPYGDVDWDGGGGNDVSGVGWGDRNKFKSLQKPVSLASGWDYSQPNTVPYAMEWIDAPDAEMGLVQTQTFEQHDAGGYWFYPARGKTSATGPCDPDTVAPPCQMPQDWNWPFQLNQYEMPFTLASKRLAWGTNYGAVGKQSYPVYGDDSSAVGWPFQSYSVAIVLGKHSDAVVAKQVTQIETVQATTLTAPGSVITAGPGGVARTDSVTYAPAGWNHVYGTWELRAAANRVRATLAVATGALKSPVIVVHDWTAGAPTEVTLDGAPLAAGSGYFASVDASSTALWITVNASLSGAHTLAIR